MGIQLSRHHPLHSIENGPLMVSMVIKLDKALFFYEENLKKSANVLKMIFFKGQDLLQLHFLEAINRLWKIRIVS